MVLKTLEKESISFRKLIMCTCIHTRGTALFVAYDLFGQDSDALSLEVLLHGCRIFIACDNKKVSRQGVSLPVSHDQS